MTKKSPYRPVPMDDWPLCQSVGYQPEVYDAVCT